MTKRKKLSWWYLGVAIGAVVASAALAVAIWPFRDTDAVLPYAIVGYALTPFFVAIVLVVVRARDLKLQGDPQYLPLDGQRLIRKVGWVVAISFVPALAHIWCIASYVGSVIA